MLLGRGAGLCAQPGHRGRGVLSAARSARSVGGTAATVLARVVFDGRRSARAVTRETTVGASRSTGHVAVPLVGPPTSPNAFVAALVGGGLPWKAYADLLAQYFFIYESLDQAAQAMADDPVAGAFVLPELNSSRTLAADLRFLRGSGWARQIVASSATSTYCARLREVAFHSPLGFVAHYVTRMGGTDCPVQRFRRVHHKNLAHSVGDQQNPLARGQAAPPAGRRRNGKESAPVHRLRAPVVGTHDDQAAPFVDVQAN
ncbi:biliverdin-producing heme oxygenase [Micromonosporaceae bacterium Da 78-11]